jgi:hypothetical protein
LLLAGAATALALFAIVSIKVLLGASTLSSGDIEGRMQAKLQRAEQLQVEVSRAESPAEITRRAIEGGMIHPETIVPLREAPPGPAKAAGPGSR